MKDFYFNSLKILQPNKPWKKWLHCTQCDQIFWDNKINQRYFFDDLGEKLDIKLAQDWYKINQKRKYLVSKLVGGTAFISNIYKFSLQKALVTLFPEYTSLLFAWKFPSVPNGYWRSLENQRFCFHALGKELNIISMDDWYKISSKTFSSLGAPLNEYNSLIEMLQTIYPSFHWEPALFLKVPRNYWNTRKNRRMFLQFISKKLKIKTVPEYYNLKYKDVESNSGKCLLLTYNSNIPQCLIDLFPETHLLPWKFNQIPPKYWQIPKNCLEFLKWCEIELEMKSLQEWKLIKQDQIIQLGGATLIKTYKSFNNILNYYYPFLNSNSIDLLPQLQLHGNKLILKSQFSLFKKIQNILPEIEIELNYKHPNLFFKNTNKKIELDIFLPSLNLAFEYQGSQHYKLTRWNGYPSIQIKRDKEKKELCQNNGITLIEIPYTWDQKNSTLIAKIKEIRPDIFILK